MTTFIFRILALLLSVFTAFSSIINTTAEKKEKNVILLIGDGMGEMHLDMTEEMRDVSLAMNTMPQQGYSMTYSANKAITDSAAGATALACGVKTANSMVGMYWTKAPGYDKPEGSYPKNITEVCMENGMKTGIITSDRLSGATPSAFSAHTEDRDNHEDITQQQMESGIDIIWGKADKTLTEEQVTQAGYTYIDTIDEMNALTGNEKSCGMFTDSVYHTYNKNEYTPTLSQMAEKAIDLLSSTSEDGFFLMIEGAHIDKKSHNEDEKGAAEALEEFDNAVSVALEFAEKDKNTLVVLTADHETGGVILNQDGTYEMTTGNHTAVNVPLRAYCAQDYTFIENGEIIENIAVPVRIANFLDFPKNSIPFEVVV